MLVYTDSRYHGEEKQLIINKVQIKKSNKSKLYSDFCKNCLSKSKAPHALMLLREEMCFHSNYV